MPAKYECLVNCDDDDVEDSKETATLNSDLQNSYQTFKNPELPSPLPFGEIDGGFDKSFWEEVGKLEENNICRSKARRTVYLHRLKQNCKEDLLVELLTKRHDDYYNLYGKSNDGKYESFLFELSHLVKILLEDDFAKPSPQYILLLQQEDGSKKSILHMAADKGLLLVITQILDFQKNMCVSEAFPDGSYPLHYSLKKGHDQASMLLIKAMDNEIVRDLFTGNREDPSIFSLRELLSCGKMKKTVEAVLDCCMSPDWQFMPVNKDDVNGLLIPDFPYFFNFYYQILDGDEKGEKPCFMKRGASIKNKRFNSNGKTCFQLIAENLTLENDMRHPLVKMLMMNKWRAFGKKTIRFYFALYLLFLITMSISFCLAPSAGDENGYSHPKDYFRLVCEIITLLFTLLYIGSELDEVLHDGWSYFSDVRNLFDVVGVVLLLVIVPLRISQSHSAEFAISATAYAMNFMRIGNYLCANKALSIYHQTFRTIIYKDLPRFMMLFILFIVGFTGTVYLVFKSTNGNNFGLIEGEKIKNKTSTAYWFLFLKEMSGITASSEFGDTDKYLATNAAILFLVFCNMFFVVVVLNDMFIGQVADRYSKAMANAKILYDIDRTKYVARLEKGSIFRPKDLRFKHYINEEKVLSKKLLDDLMDDAAMQKRVMEKCNIASYAPAIDGCGEIRKSDGEMKIPPKVI